MPKRLAKTLFFLLNGLAALTVERAYAVGGGEQPLPTPLVDQRVLTADELSAQSLIREIYQSYDSRDLRPFLAKIHAPQQYTDVEVTTLNKGWNDYIQNHVAAEIGIIESSQHQIDLLHFDNMGKLSYLLYRYHVNLTAGGEPFASEGIGSAVLVKQQGEWRMRHRHTSENSVQAKAKADTIHQMVHPLRNLSDGEPVPRLKLRIIADTMSGWNVFFDVENFTLTGEGVGGEYRSGEGHAHLYVDGRKLARVYGNAFQVSSLAPGKHLIRATLNSHNHQRLAVDSVEIADETTLFVPEPISIATDQLSVD